MENLAMQLKRQVITVIKSNNIKKKFLHCYWDFNTGKKVIKYTCCPLVEMQVQSKHGPLNIDKFHPLKR